MPNSASMRRTAGVLFRLNQDMLIVAAVISIALASASAMIAV